MLKCLEKKPANRFFGLRELREELDGSAEGRRRQESQVEQRLAQLKAEGSRAGDEGRCADAVALWQEALALRPGDAELEGRVAEARQRKAMMDESEARARRAEEEATERRKQEEGILLERYNALKAQGSAALMRASMPRRSGSGSRPSPSSPEMPACAIRSRRQRHRPISPGRRPNDGRPPRRGRSGSSLRSRRCERRPARGDTGKQRVCCTRRALHAEAAGNADTARVPDAAETTPCAATAGETGDARSATGWVSPKGSRKNKFALWRERRAGKCLAPRRRRWGDIVEERQRRRCLPAAAPRRAAAPRPPPLFADFWVLRRLPSDSIPGWDHGPGSQQQNAKFFARALRAWPEDIALL